VDLETQDWNRSLGMLVPGQSGHPMSANYADNIEGWLKGEYHTMLFDRAAILKETDATLVIELV
jgi:acyl-homoserine lactone acylase PvdQ